MFCYINQQSTFIIMSATKIFIHETTTLQFNYFQFWSSCSFVSKIKKLILINNDRMLLRLNQSALLLTKRLIPSHRNFRYKYNTYSFCNYIIMQTPSTGELPTKKQMIPSTLDQLKVLSKVVADTADFNEIEKYHPDDSTTNPSLLLQMMSSPNQELINQLLDESIHNAKVNFALYNTSRSKNTNIKNVTTQLTVYSELNEKRKKEFVNLVLDYLAVNFGVELLKRIPGYVSTEIDAALSFDTDATFNRARRIIELYKEKGVDPKRVLIKVAATWEGIKAAEMLRKHKINCNMTLIFSKIQAIQCAESKLFLISPFVGRILDWFKKNNPTADYTGANHPGVKSVNEIYNYFKFYNYETIVMAASFRSSAEILELAGCDRLTISTSLLKELGESNEDVVRKLSVEKAEHMQPEKLILNEAEFRYRMNADAMATQKLAEGIRKFDEDTSKLKDIVVKRLEKSQIEEKEKKEQHKEDKKQK